MPPKILTALLLLLSPGPGLAQGLIGYGITLFRPLCATSCRSLLARPELSCSVEAAHGHMASHGHGPMLPFMTPAGCYAVDDAYLTSMALCLDKLCAADVSTADKEVWWAWRVVDGETVAGRSGPVPPKWTYGEALARGREAVGEGGTAPVFVRGKLNFTASVNVTEWRVVMQTYQNYEWSEEMHATYGIAILVLGVGVPIILTLINHVPITSAISRLLSPYLSLSVFRGYYVRALPHYLGNPPTIGQALLIFSFVSLNVVFAAVDIKTVQPHRMFRSHYINTLVNVANRTGILAFALSPLVALLAARNNMLLWLTDWPHSTYMLLHRWVARVWLLQAVAHSIVELLLYTHQNTFAVEQWKPYWMWGVAATMAGVLLILTAVTWMRRRHYEVFLMLHIVLAVFVLVGSWYHVWLLYRGARGFEAWLYACFAVWAGDRVARVWRASMTGSKSAVVTDLGNDVVRVDVPGVDWHHTPGMHAYAYFPTLTWRPWESHPFSVVPTALIARLEARATRKASSGVASDRSSSVDVAPGDEEKGPALATSRPANEQIGGMRIGTTTGMTLFIRRGNGLTRHLQPSTAVKTWLEGPYHDRGLDEVQRCDRLVCVAGGIGITGVLPAVAAHLNARLLWSLREADDGLARDLKTVTDALDEREVQIGSRFDVEGVLAREVSRGYGSVGVVVCGPPGLCDDVRSIVARMGRQKGETRLVLAVEAFAW